MDHLVDLGVSAVDWYEQIWPRLRTRAYLLAGAFWLAAGILLLSLGTVLLGSFGDGVETATVGLFGLAAYAAPLLLGWYGVQEVRGRSLPLLVISSDLACGLAASLMLGATLDQGGAVGNAAGRLASTMLGGWYGAAFIAACMVAMALSARWGFTSSKTSAGRAKAAKGLKAVDTTTLFQAPAAPAAAVPSSVCISELVHASTAPSEVVTPVTPVPPVRATKGLRIVPKRTSLPSLDLLEASERPSSLRDRADEETVTKKLEEVLADHNIVAKVEDLFQGPQVTTYEVSIAAGTKVSRVLGLAEEVSFALGRKVRALVSPVSAGRIAFEVPNAARQAVCLKSLLAANSGTLPGNEEVLPLALGLDVRGKVVTTDLAAMPHVVVAGSTGSGKSVGLNAMILSLLFKRTPAEVRFVMIDVKQVELTPFNGIPHLLKPVITDAAEAAVALEEMTSEMERRFALLSAAGAKNIGSYNMKRSSPSEQLARIVIVIDEFADLIAQQGKDKSVENAVQRLGQKARACGIHMILATQRPSTDVVTGSIKANVPARIAFRVAQGVDSRVVLDSQGAEDLLGKGDALVQLGDGSDMRRVQFPNVTEGEVERVISYLRGQS
jgi:DNA segregation ATPase FtsK/SpoIIIE, S-DNA-T family